MPSSDENAPTPAELTTATAPEPAPAGDQAEAEVARQQTLLEQLGGFSGLIYSTLPVLVFVPVNTLAGLTAAIWASLGVAAAILVWRLVRRDPVQPAISGFIGVGICAFIAYRMGEAKGFFLFGIYTSLVYGGVFLASILVRWPLVGVIWGCSTATAANGAPTDEWCASTTSPRWPGCWCSVPGTWCSRTSTTPTTPAGSPSPVSRWAGR